jgi:hypothetical protein
MRREMLTQRALFCIDVMAKTVTLSQHFVTYVLPPLMFPCITTQTRHADQWFVLPWLPTSHSQCTIIPIH